MTAINRRRALTGSAAIAVGAPVLAACGSDDSNAGEPASADDTSTSTPSDDAASGSAGGSAGGGETLASAADVPVGGCFVVAAAKVVLTQPAEGDFKAFSAVCTHQGCLVESSSDGEIPCPCHASRFSLEDGSPQSGPATASLEPVAITVDRGSISRA